MAMGIPALSFSVFGPHPRSVPAETDERNDYFTREKLRFQDLVDKDEMSWNMLKCSEMLLGYAQSPVQGPAIDESGRGCDFLT